LDGDCCYRTVGAPRGNNASGDVHLAQDPAAEDMAAGIDVARAGHNPQDWLAVSVDGPPSQGSRVCTGGAPGWLSPGWSSFAMWLLCFFRGVEGSINPLASGCLEGDWYMTIAAIL